MNHPKSRKKEILLLQKQLEDEANQALEIEAKIKRQESKIQRILNGEEVEDDEEKKRKKKKKKHQ
jgi:hypothetical protein